MALKFVDMFCGMGTIRMGFEQAGWECVYSVEWDKHKRRIYEVIFGREPEGQDIRTVRGSELPAADCWCFGAPCQDFSIAGKRAGMEGDRSSLVKEVFRLVRETTEENRPRWLLYENVKGMLSSNRGLDFLGIVLEMESLGYDVEWQLLNSKDFGVPQNRERVFTLGHFRGRCERKIFPIGEINPKTLKQILGGSQGDRVYDSEGISCTLSTGITKMGAYMVKQIGQVSSDGSQAGKVYDTEGIMPTICAGTHGYANGHIEIKACLTPDRAEKRQNGRRFKEDGEPMFTLTKQDIHGVLISKKSDKNLYDFYNKRQRTDGICGTLTSGGNTSSLRCGSFGVMITHNIPQMVKVRKHEVDVEGLKRMLRDSKCYTNKEIAEKLNKPITLVEHWFRNDRSFAIPDSDIWLELKKLLYIKTDEFDKSILEWVEKEGSFEKANRVYDEQGISPTLTKASADEKIINQGRIRRLTPRECMRLQGVSDEVTDKLIAAGISDTQMYRAAGDATTVNVLYEIASRLGGRG